MKRMATSCHIPELRTFSSIYLDQTTTWSLTNNPRQAVIGWMFRNMLIIFSSWHNNTVTQFKEKYQQELLGADLIGQVGAVKFDAVGWVNGNVALNFIHDAKYIYAGQKHLKQSNSACINVLLRSKNYHLTASFRLPLATAFAGFLASLLFRHI